MRIRKRGPFSNPQKKQEPALTRQQFGKAGSRDKGRQIELGDEGKGKKAPTICQIGSFQDEKAWAVNGVIRSPGARPR